MSTNKDEYRAILFTFAYLARTGGMTVHMEQFRIMPSDHEKAETRTDGSMRFLVRLNPEQAEEDGTTVTVPPGWLWAEQRTVIVRPYVDPEQRRAGERDTSIDAVRF